MIKLSRTDIEAASYAAKLSQLYRDLARVVSTWSMNLLWNDSALLNFFTWCLFHRDLDFNGMVESMALISCGRNPVSLLVSLGIWCGEEGSSVIISFVLDVVGAMFDMVVVEGG